MKVSGGDRMGKIDYKKEYRDLYLPKTKPMIIEVPPITYVTVVGKGNPNTSHEYQEALELLYGLSFTIKMSKMTDEQIPGYFDYVVPPLEGLWWSDDSYSELPANKDQYLWKSMIRLPEFVTVTIFNQAKAKLLLKKPYLNVAKAKYEIIDEGKCVQMMHIGSYDNESVTLDIIKQYLKANHLETDFNENRKHHEIYLSDPRRCKTENLKTVIRLPIKQL